MSTRLPDSVDILGGIDPIHSCPLTAFQNPLYNSVVNQDNDDEDKVQGTRVCRWDLFVLVFQREDQARGQFED